MIQWMLAIWSLPFLKRAWTFGSSWFMYCWSLAWRILSITLLACAAAAAKSLQLCPTLCQPRDRTLVSCVSCIGRPVLHHWATWEAQATSNAWGIKWRYKQTRDTCLEATYLLLQGHYIDLSAFCGGLTNFAWTELIWNTSYKRTKLSTRRVHGARWRVCGEVRTTQVGSALGWTPWRARATSPKGRVPPLVVAQIGAGR